MSDSKRDTIPDVEPPRMSMPPEPRRLRPARWAILTMAVLGWAAVLDACFLLHPVPPPPTGDGGTVVTMDAPFLPPIATPSDWPAGGKREDAGHEAGP